MSRRKKQIPVTPVPAYAELAWFYGLNAGAADLERLTKDVKREADNRNIDDSTLIGAWGSPFGVMAGALLNGAPIIRPEPEEREGIRARHFRAVRARWQVSTMRDPEGVLDWAGCLGDALEELGLEAPPAPPRVDLPYEAEPSLAHVGYQLVSLRGAPGLLVYGALLEGAGPTFAEGDVETFTLEADGVTMRVVGVVVARVDAQQSTALLASQADWAWRKEAAARVTAACPLPEGQACDWWLVAP